ncbi:MAG: hypothetical protein HPY65_15325 [Syntrophaceae bacterium]|nr:hypothetical protein [Syntrophaceae bacterium]
MQIAGGDGKTRVLSDWQRDRESSRTLPTVESSRKGDRRNLPILRNAVQQSLTLEAADVPDRSIIDVRDDYEGNWFVRRRDVRNGYAMAWENRPEKGLYIDVRA